MLRHVRISLAKFLRVAGLERVLLNSGAADGDGDVNLSVGQSANHSILVGIRSVHVHGGVIAATLLLIAVAVFILVTTTFSNQLETVSRAPTPNPLTQGSPYALDVAVLPFAAVNNQDATCTAFADQLSQNLAQLSESSLKAPTSTLMSSGIKIWRPEQINFRTPTPTDANQPDGQNWMARFAESRKVDIVLFGLVNCKNTTADANSNPDAGTISVMPQFYVSPEYFKHAPELVGTYDFGAFERTINKSSDSIALDEFNQELLNRAKTVVQLGQGFEYYARDDYKNYLNAAQIFQSLLDSNTLMDHRGQAVLHYMLGNAYMRASTNDCEDVLPDMLREAEHQYGLAVTAEPEFASAYVGLGSIMSQWAQNASLGISGETNAQASIVQDYLIRGQTYFTQALKARINPANANIEFRVAMGKAQALVIKHDLLSPGDEGLLTEAETYLNLVISGYLTTTENQTSLKSLAAHAYSLLGDVYASQAFTEDALSQYERAQNLATDDKLRTDIALRIADISTLSGNACVAAQQLQIAINTLCIADRADLAARALDAQHVCRASFDTK